MIKLPELIGSKQQTKWASNIREAFIIYSHYREYFLLKKMRAEGKKVAPAAEVKPIIGVMERVGIKADVCDYIKRIEEALQNKNASWWIDNRYRLRAGVVPGVPCEWFDEE